MASTQVHVGMQRQTGREQALLRPQRDHAQDLHAAFQPQRIVGNAAIARGSMPPPETRTTVGVQQFVRRAAALIVQPKLVLGPVNDAYEQEADQVSRQVVQRLAAPAVQREEDEEELQASRDPGGPSALTPDIEAGIQTARAGGSPLKDGTRAAMEEAFGADFGAVRVHTGPQAAQLNQQIQARAFTTGRDIFFREGEYDPGSTAGQQLLAHELTHVVQQGAAGSVRAQRAAAGDVQRDVAREALFFTNRLA